MPTTFLHQLFVATGTTTHTIHLGAILIGLIGGLALFLFGMEQMTAAMKFLAGGGMKTLLARMTSNRLKSVATGAFVTAVVNSSSVTTVLVVGFISAGLMTLSQSMGIIFGANIGSTFTAQLIAFNITKYSLLMVACGFVMHVASPNDKVKQYGVMLLGLGLLFFGMSLMSDATKPLRSYQPFIDLMKKMNDPILGIAIGAFLGLLSKSTLTESQTEELHDLISVANYFENIGDIVETNMVALGMERLNQNVEISESTIQTLEPLFKKVYCSVEQAFICLQTSDIEIAKDILSVKKEIQRLATQAHRHLAARLTADRPNRLEAFRLETDIIENLRHLYYFAKRIAKILAEDDVQYEREERILE